MIRSAASSLVAGIAIVTPHIAEAQPLVDAKAAVSSETVEVGEPFVVEFSAMSAARVRFADPTLRLPPGLTASSPSMGQKTLVQMTPGGTMFQRGVGVKWQVVAGSAGRFTIPPPSILADGRPVASGTALRITVVARGTRPRGGGAPSDPFGIGGLFDDPFASLLGGSKPKSRAELVIDEPVRDLDSLGANGRALALGRGDDEWLFLRVVPDKSRAVVGEQVTLRFYEYYRVTNERFDEREPQLADFLRVPLEDEPAEAERVTTAVGGKVWFAQELNRIAVFPLRAGTLRTGSLSAQFRVPYLGGQPVRRQSQEVALVVDEPPSEGRPAGYRIGDVGSFALSATVSPRQTIAGETVTVSLRVEGRGAMPNELALPSRRGVEWYAPDKQDGPDVIEGRVGGWRTFGHAVRLSEAGEIDLGTVEFPHYDPADRAYRIARASLGTVRVLPNGKGDTSAPAGGTEADPFARLPEVRRLLGPFERPSVRAPSPAAFVASVAAAPLAVILGGLALRMARGWQLRRRERRRAPAQLAKDALAALAAAETPALAAAAAERALHHALEAATGIKSRGILLEDLPLALSSRGVDERLAHEARRLLAACESLRFAPAAEGANSLDVTSAVRSVALDLLRSQGPGTA